MLKSVKSPLRWRGGKSRLSRRIAAMLPEHVCYCEPFCGGASVLFAKPPSKVEIINDINGELMNFWRVVRVHPEEFCRQFDNILISRAEFERIYRLPPETLTDIQRAARFFYIQRLAFGGRWGSKPIFCATKSQRPPLNLRTLERLIELASARLAYVQVENLHWLLALTRFDGADSLFYIDPPYFGCEMDYGKGFFCRADFARLADTLPGLQGRFLLSLNDTPETREIFKAFPCHELQTSYCCANGILKKGKRVTELVFSNYEIKAG